MAIAALAAWIGVAALVFARLYSPPACPSGSGSPIESEAIVDAGAIARSQSPEGARVILSTGTLIENATDMVVSGPAPIVVRRSYRTFHPQAREFGRGTSHTYGVFLYSAKEYEEADLYLPDELPVHYVRTSPGTAWYDAVFKSTSIEPDFAGSTLAWNGAGWDLSLIDGTVLLFGERAPLQAVRYANGRSLFIRRQSGDPNGSIRAVVTSTGRCIGFDYDDRNRIIKATDDTGRSIRYGYDAAGYLATVTAPDGGITRYAYDEAGRLARVTARETEVLTATYDPSGRVKRLARPDGSEAYTYLIDATGAVSATYVTGADGLTKRVWP